MSLIIFRLILLLAPAPHHALPGCCMGSEKPPDKRFRPGCTPPRSICMLRIHLFGQPHISSEDKPLRFVALPKTWPLLAYIMMHRDRPIERQTLAFTLWPDDSESGARANLRRHLQELRRTLPQAAPGAPWLLVNYKTVQWNSEADYWLDTMEFERLAGASDSLAEAVALYKGDL